MKELEALWKAYMDKYPNADDPTNYFASFGIGGLTDVLKEANGREIGFKTDTNGNVTYSFR